ncbi:hypothetical protein [Marivita cryptomonadis]|uniref:hypothetical protein n=1 Tax=Marivita cryptomonadis TaxID=505252 RepID=UPI003919744C
MRRAASRAETVSGRGDRGRRKGGEVEDALGGSEGGQAGRLPGGFVVGRDPSGNEIELPSARPGIAGRAQGPVRRAPLAEVRDCLLSYGASASRVKHGHVGSATITVVGYAAVG